MLMRSLFLGFTLVAAPAFADPGTPIDERRPLNADARLSVTNVAGEIEVSAWDRNELHLTGELGEGVEKLDISGDAASLRIEVKYPRKSHQAEETTLRLRVPAGVRLDLEAVSADIVVRDTRGPLRAQSVSGDVTLSVASTEVDAHSVSGDVILRAPQSSATRLNTVSGDVSVSGVRGRLRLETVSGNVQVLGEGMTELQLKSVSGDIEVQCSLSGPPRIEMESLSGTIRLSLDKTPDARVELRTFSGELMTEFGERARGGAKRYEATLGDGKGRIHLSTFSGDVRLAQQR